MFSNYTYVDAFRQEYPTIDLVEYFTFIESARLPKRIKFKTAAHHILPRWAFGQYSNFARFPWNRVILTHSDHLVAHFLLWKSWRVAQNASPLLLMCSTQNISKFDDDNMINAALLYGEACIAHAKQVSKRHTGKYVSPETRKKISDSRTRHCATHPAHLSCKLVATDETVWVTVAEYRANRGLYKHFAEGTPSWNSGLKLPSGKLTVHTKGTTEKVRLTSEEYAANKDLYDHTGKGNKGCSGRIPVIELTTDKRITITTAEFWKNNHLYKHAVTSTRWYNNGVDNLRLPQSSSVPAGYVLGRVPNRFECPHCNRIGTTWNFKRFHYDNCKSLNSNAHGGHSIL